MIRIDYRTIDDLAREVSLSITRKDAVGLVLRLHPELHDWVLRQTAPGEQPMVWILPVSRGPVGMENLYETIAKFELPPGGT